MQSKRNVHTYELIIQNLSARRVFNYQKMNKSVPRPMTGVRWELQVLMKTRLKERHELKITPLPNCDAERQTRSSFECKILNSN